MGKFTKEVLTQWVEFACDRQLLLNLGRDDTVWIDPPHEIKPLEMRFRHRATITKLGKNYEQEIYYSLRRLHGSRSNRGSDGDIVPSQLTREELQRMYEEIDSSTSLVLLEYEFPFERKLLYDIFQLNPSDHIVMSEPQNVRPDVLVVRKLKQESERENRVYELKVNGEVKEVKKSELSSRLSIQIYDIKYTNEQNVGKKHFIEILFYAHALAAHLEKLKMRDKFFVNIDRNGIIPAVKDRFISSFEELSENVVEMKWKEVSRVYLEALKTIQRLTRLRPCNYKITDPNIQPKCGRCSYLEDCKASLGIGMPDTSQYDVQLLPYTNTSLAKQLKAEGMETVGDVMEKISDIELGATPNAIYPEASLLLLKSQAIVNETQVTPPTGSITSTAIPRFTEISIVLDTSNDIAHDRVYATAMSMNCIVFRKSNYFDLFNTFLNLINECVNGDLTEERIKSELQLLIKKEVQLVDIRTFVGIIQDLQKEVSTTISVNLEKEHVGFTANYVYISLGLEDEDELILLKQLIQKLVQFFKLAEIIEKYIVITREYEDKEIEFHPRTGLFYWYSETLTSIEEMIQRHLERLFTDNDVQRDLAYFTSWIAPSDSGVKNPNQQKKMYDLGLFVESVIGLPLVLNYTWHEVYKQINKKAYVNEKYWRKHYNFMFSDEWYNLLEEKNSTKREEQYNSLKKQFLFKLMALNTLRVHFQKMGRDQISRQARPAQTYKARLRDVPKNFHKIAYIWYRFAKLSGAFAELEAEDLRHTFVEYSIGKLAAAKLENMQVTAVPSGRSGFKYRYHFELHGPSTNVKFREKDFVLLVPERLRDDNRVKTQRWQIVIDKMRWDSERLCYVVTSELVNKNFYLEYQQIVQQDKRNGEAISEENEQPGSWYIYPNTSDHWSRKLFGDKDALLTKKNLGSSWLGHRLSYKMKYTLGRLKAPEESTYTMQEVIVYFPKLLERIKKPTGEAIKELKSQFAHEPNSSQRDAILLTQNNILSAIHGPPGTGKSQTIVTLLEEHIFRSFEKGKSIRILITAFGYQALIVLLEKMCDFSLKNNKQSLVSKIQKIFMRSEWRDPVSNNLADDLVTTGSWKLNGKPRIVTRKTNLLDHLEHSFVIFATPQQIFKLQKRKNNNLPFPKGFAFDLIIGDEISQMPLDQFLSPLLFVSNHSFHLEPKEKYVDTEKYLTELPSIDHFQIKYPEDDFEKFTKVVLVGDQNQLPPVQPIMPPKKLRLILGNAFSYFVSEESHAIPTRQLEVNYRSHEQIVAYTRELGFYIGLIASKENANSTISGNFTRIQDKFPEWVKKVMDPEKIVLTIIHNTQFDKSVSKIEAEIVEKIVLAYFQSINIQSEEEEKDFWERKVGVVTPHNAQGRLIIRMLFETLTKSSLTKLKGEILMSHLLKTVVSVEKFQGSDRDMIIATVGVSAKDQIEAEEEFIYSLNRFNVLTSRARAKIVMVCSWNFLNHLPNDRNILEQGAKIRQFAIDFCNSQEKLQIGQLKVDLRYRKV